MKCVRGCSWNTRNQLEMLNPLPILELEWEHMVINFIVGLPITSNKHDSIRVIVDRLIKSAHFIPSYSMDKLAQIFLGDYLDA